MIGIFWYWPWVVLVLCFIGEMFLLRSVYLLGRNDGIEEMKRWIQFELNKLKN